MEKRSQHALSILGTVFPMLSIASLLTSRGLALTESRSLALTCMVMVSVSAVFSFAYLATSLLRILHRSILRSACSLALGVLLAFIVYGSFKFEIVRSLRLDVTPRVVSLNRGLNDAAFSASKAASDFLRTGKSGELVGFGWNETHWTNPAGGYLDIAISWTRNDKGILVTASPVGAVPAGEDGTPGTQQVRQNGMCEFPIDYYEQQGKIQAQGSFDLFSPVYFMFNDVLQATGVPVLERIKSQGDGSITDQEAKAILDKAKTVFPIKGDGGDPRITVTMTGYTYQAKPDGLFDIRYEWTVSSKDGEKAPETKSGSFVMTYTTDGHLAWYQGADPLTVFMNDV